MRACHEGHKEVVQLLLKNNVYLWDKDPQGSTALGLAKVRNKHEVVDLFKDIQVCAVCNMFASKRCGKCKAVYYCEDVCQKKNWKNHKKSCKKLA